MCLPLLAFVNTQPFYLLDAVYLIAAPENMHVNNGLYFADEFIVFAYSIDLVPVLFLMQLAPFLFTSKNKIMQLLFVELNVSTFLPNPICLPTFSSLVLGTSASLGAYTKRFLFAPLAVRYSNNTDKLPFFFFLAPFLFGFYPGMEISFNFLIQIIYSVYIYDLM